MTDTILNLSHPCKALSKCRWTKLPACNSSFLSRVCGALLGTLLSLGLSHSPASADPVADFYNGKTIRLIIATTPGNDYDFRGRLLARFMGRFIPGKPTIVPENMPGAGGITATNYLASVAPRDGTVLNMIKSNMMSAQAIKAPGVQFDTRKFAWIGNTTNTPNVTNTWYTTGVASIEQAKTRELAIGADMGTAGVTYLKAMNELVGTKFKIVTGYPGGNEINLAMERGEVDGRASNSWESWKSTHPDWLADKKLNILVQVGLTRAVDLPDVPLLLELTRNDEDRRVLTFLSADTAIARSLVTTPNVPADRLAALRHAFDETMKDPQFLAEAAKTKMDITPTSGEEAQKIADSIVDTSPQVTGRAAALLGAAAD